MTKGLKSVTFETREPPPPTLLSLFILWPQQPQRPATCDLRPLPLPPRQGVCVCVCPHFYCVFAPSHFLFVICYLLFVIWYLLFAIASHVESVSSRQTQLEYIKHFFCPNFKCNFTPRFFFAILKFSKYPVAMRKECFNFYCILMC